MEATSLVFSGGQISSGEIALEAFMARLRTVQDSGIPSGPTARAPMNIWTAVAKGRGLPDFVTGGVIKDVQDYQAPCILVFDDTDENVSENAHWDEDYCFLHLTLVQFIYVEQAENATTKLWEYPDVVPIQRNMKDATLAHLWVSNVGSSEIFPWWVESPQRVQTDFTGVLSRFEYKVQPPWWACETRITLGVWRGTQTNT